MVAVLYTRRGASAIARWRDRSPSAVRVISMRDVAPGEVAQRQELAFRASLRLHHASRHELPEDELARRIGLEPLERARIADAEAIEESGHRVSTKHALLGHVTRRLFLRGQDLGKRDVLAHDAPLGIGGNRSGRDSEGRDDGKGGDKQREKAQHQRTQ